MAKQGQHRNDIQDSAKSKGPNRPEKSVPITTGTPKKQETYARQAAERKATNRQAQNKHPRWEEDMRDLRRVAMRATNTSTRASQGDLDSSRSGTVIRAAGDTRL
jgi:hypothetical protein